MQMHLITPGLPIIDAVIAHPGKALQGLQHRPPPRALFPLLTTRRSIHGGRLVMNLHHEK